MKKIPTLFKRTFDENHHAGITHEVTPGCEWVLRGEGRATMKIDGSCCAIIQGKLYKRYDCKANRQPPEGFIPCQEPDLVTGHWPGWVLVDPLKPEDQWFCDAYCNTMENRREAIGMNGIFPLEGGEIDHRAVLEDGTYEAIGPHFRGNPYKLTQDALVLHGYVGLPRAPRDFDGLKEYLKAHDIEGIVFWKGGPDDPMCKIKRSDFGFEWGRKKA